MNGRFARGRGGPRWMLPAALALALTASLLAGCVPAARQAAPARARQSGKTAVTKPTHAITRLGPADPGRELDITIVLAGQAPGQLDQTLAAINNPASPEYHHYLTPDQYTQRFGAPPAAVAQVARTLQAAGLSITQSSSDGLLLRARGTVARIDALFGVTIANFRSSDGTAFYAATSAPRLPTALRGVVAGVLGLDNQRVMVPRQHARQAQAGGQEGFTPADLASAYDLSALHQGGLDGSGQTIALAEIDTFKQADIDTYDAAYNITADPVQTQDVDGGAGTPGDVSETTLDIEVIHAIAPKAHIIAYEGAATLQGFVDLFNQAVSAHNAQVLSISLGVCEQLILHPDQAPSDVQGFFDEPGPGYFAALDTVFKQADAQGMSILASSGDTGAYDCSHIDPSDHTVSTTSPASSPYITAVGGTALFLNDDGTYSHESGWEDPLEGAGGGGGLSAYYHRPTWQTGPGTSSQYSNGMREVPDVSANADALTGYAIYDSSSAGQDNGCDPTSNGPDGCWTVIGGTSAAAPLWASITLLGDQAAQQKKLPPLGFLNPALYRVGGAAASPGPYHDVTTGGNLLYPATNGYDLSTGWGTPDGRILIPELLAPPTANTQSGG